MSNIIDAVGSYNPTTSTTASEIKTKRLQSSLQNIENSSDEELMNVCKEFEAYFLEQVFKSMEKTVMKDESDSSNSAYVSYFKEQMTQEYAANATETGGYGLAQTLYESMKRNL